ncbi:MAG: tRNA 2-thiouridine(34) synthase MnmA, partial [Bacteroidaceae bacterium]|nr:tRNA 2-thiouridine(34) synthase MnmA [Bacteroidaceae bacterium]
MNNRRVLMGMSGGIDSTAACLMLQEQGYEVIGVTMRVFDLASQLNAEGTPHFISEAREVAQRLGIEHHVADEREGFRSKIVQYFIDEYMQGRTPNPCVICNPLFKFRVLTEWADRLDCAYIATGHYVQTINEQGYHYIVTGDDPQKDQSYFLWALGQEVLSRCLFPLGGWKKPDVRQYLADKGFTLKAKEGESMEVCFIEGDYRDFLRQHCPQIDNLVGEGKFVDSAGRPLGIHQGYPYYTIGQRKGLGIALGKPAYVLKLNPDKNTVMLGDAQDLATRYMLVEQMRVVDAQRFATEQELSVRIRYRSKSVSCTVVRQVDDGRVLIRFHEEVSAVTPGQSAVFYVG